jgi:hypothetical protein
MNTEKSDFLRFQLFDALAALDESATAKWGLMNAQQMLEHLADFFDVSYEKLVFPLSVPEEHLPRYKAFLYSDKDFRENTKAPENVLGETPIAERFGSLDAAKKNLQQSVDNFIKYFEENPGKQTMHPAFGLLSYEEWVLLHFKHVKHHLTQFHLFPL